MISISIEYPLQLHKQETKEVAQTDNEKIGKKGRKKDIDPFYGQSKASTMRIEVYNYRIYNKTPGVSARRKIPKIFH